ncbi:DUF6779 domain-containing protein [Nocardia sp. NPDC004068]|uniref:DUF6779 domain-containing protein n=1 Tax=Nocardia sp. NPDC004068 TaxID=3364303 RepID=UPI00367E8257
MVSPARSSTSRRWRDYAGKFLIGILILLGLIASVFLIFSDSLQLVRVGLVAALWAAVLGALAATRYRREAANDQARARELRTVYELQLEREISARREYELTVEARVREKVGADAAELAALRAELSVLRESLQRLFDGGLPNQRPALHADAFRLPELPGVANGNSRETDTWDAWNAPAVPLDVTPVFETDHTEPPAFASPFDDPVTAETAVVSAEELADLEAERVGPERPRAEPERPSKRERDRESGDGDGDRAESQEQAEPEQLGPVRPEVVDHPKPAEQAGPVRLASEPPEARQPATPAEPETSEPEKPAPAPKSGPEPTAHHGPERRTPMGTAGSRRRRRADDEDGDDDGPRLSVAEIMANLRAEQSGR